MKQIAYVTITCLSCLAISANAAETLTANQPAATNQAAVAPAVRPEKWAQPMQLDGAPNLFKINDSLYRSAQPTDVGMTNLKKLGIKTVINLRSFHTDRDELKGLGLKGEHIYMKAWHPEFKEAVRFMQIISDTNNLPVLVHCQHGADRTGTMSAIYRIAVQNWTKDDAIKEMTEGGFGFHEIWTNLPPWIKDLDIEALRKAMSTEQKAPARKTK
jgi:protein tyrosine phosphatase (PTP) superfamily phosphohydrolase (DUF442 family)